MNYRDLRGFLFILEKKGYLKRVSLLISPDLEMTEISSRVLKSSGPAILFENPKGYSIPVLCNLFGSFERIALGMGQENLYDLREIGKLLAFLKEPRPPNDLRDLLNKFSKFRNILHMSTKRVKKAPCYANVIADNDVDLGKIPIMHCWPDDVAPVITWGLTITRCPIKKRLNVGVYRQQLLDKNKLIMRWLPHRGGALDFDTWKKCNAGQPFPVSVVLGADPAMLLSAVMPIPDTLSEYSFAGFLRRYKTEVVKCISSDLDVPASAEIILEGYLEENNNAVEGPLGDHTGYYNDSAFFPVFTVTHIACRDNAIYHSTYTGRPPDEPSVLGVAMNEIFIPILQNQFPEIVDFYLPPEGCSYRIAVVTIKKQYVGHAKRIMLGIWSFLRQFMYTKFIIICDDDVDARNWQDVIWAVTTRMDPVRDSVVIDNTSVDYLDFSSPVSGLGSKMGMDATNKWPGETQRTWGVPIKMANNVVLYIDSIWDKLFITDN